VGSPRLTRCRVGLVGLSKGSYPGFFRLASISGLSLCCAAFEVGVSSSNTCKPNCKQPHGKVWPGIRTGLKPPTGHRVKQGLSTSHPTAFLNQASHAKRNEAFDKRAGRFKSKADAIARLEVVRFGLINRH
jgi:hypothetical protein